MVDRNIVLRKLSDLDKYLNQIGEFSGITLQEYKDDWKTQRIVERTLQMMIETCADIATHIISDRALRPPVTYADAFIVLKENGIIDAGLSSAMEKMAKFRNVVVHQYEAVDAAIVLAILSKHLADFDRFKEAVLLYLKTSGNAGDR